MCSWPVSCDTVVFERARRRPMLGRATTAPRRGRDGCSRDGCSTIFQSGFVDLLKKRRPVKQYRSSAHMPHAHMHIGGIWILPTVDQPPSPSQAAGPWPTPRHTQYREAQYCRYCRARCTLHVKSSPSDGWSGAIWTDPAGPKYGTTTRALATWTAPGWTDQRFVVGYVDRFCCVDRYSRCYVDRNWYWNDVGDTFSFY